MSYVILFKKGHQLDFSLVIFMCPKNAHISKHYFKDNECISIFASCMQNAHEKKNHWCIVLCYVQFFVKGGNMLWKRRKNKNCTL